MITHNCVYFLQLCVRLFQLGFVHLQAGVDRLASARFCNTLDQVFDLPIDIGRVLLEVRAFSLLLQQKPLVLLGYGLDLLFEGFPGEDVIQQRLEYGRQHDVQRDVPRNAGGGAEVLFLPAPELSPLTGRLNDHWGAAVLAFRPFAKQVRAGIAARPAVCRCSFGYVSLYSVVLLWGDHGFVCTLANDHIVVVGDELTVLSEAPVRFAGVGRVTEKLQD